MTILEKIISYKRNEVEVQKTIIPIERLKSSERLFSVRNFKNALSGTNLNIIAEIKRYSPSENNIMLDADPAKVARSYEENGASAISVLTDKHFFGGELDFVQKVKSVVNIPVLRKDFIVSEYQVWESFHAGADAILLIADAIEYDLLVSLYKLAKKLGMHVLVEVHDLHNLKLFSTFAPEIIGVNCRDLKTMNTDITWFESIYKKLPNNTLKVAESGIQNNEDLCYVFEIGYDAALVGTSLMKTRFPGQALSKLLNRVSL